MMRHFESVVCERLEERLVLGSHLPTLGMLEDPSNSVVRIETSMGDIDFELFDAVSPGIVTNFLNYVKGGDFGESFFHRSATIAGDTDFVLQGGGFRFADATGLDQVPQDEPVLNEFGRSNLTRTVSMARQAFQPNSATSQFFINLADNTFLDTTDGDGFTVFARVLGDDSWAVVQTIVGLAREDLRTDPSFAGDFAGAFTEVPVTAAYDSGAGVAEDSLVYIIDAELIKAGGADAFFEYSIYQPEGYAAGSVSETLSMVNTTGVAAYYQVVARAETPQARTAGQIAAAADFWYRDRVVAEGVIGAGTKLELPVSRFADASSDLVNRYVPYAFEIQSTQRLGAAVEREDFSAPTGEAFVSSGSTTWTFGAASNQTGTTDFLVWQNVTGSEAAVSVTFVFESDSPITRTYSLGAYRRGGLELFNLDFLPANQAFSVEMSADQTIVAALSHYQSAGAGSGSLSLGRAGAASQFAVLAGASMASGAGQTLTITNTSGSAATVGLTISFEDSGTPDVTIPAALSVPAMSRRTFDFASVSQVADGTPFSVRVSSNIAVYADGSRTVGDDAATTPFEVAAGRNHHFAVGFMDSDRAGIDLFETISIYNPNSVFFAGSDTTANLTIRFRYTDGYVMSTTAVVSGGERMTLDLHALALVLDESTGGRRDYAIQILADVPVVAQIDRLDLAPASGGQAGGFGTGGTILGALWRLDSL